MKFLLFLAYTVFCAAGYEDSLETRIIGGEHAQLGQFPFQVGLFGHIPNVTTVIVCGGSLVTPYRVITAAHCWFNGTHQANNMTVILGTKKLYFGGIRQTTSKVIMHPGWNPEQHNNDVAVVFLSQFVVFTDFISPIALPSGSEIYESFEGEWAVVSGFGLTSSNGSISDDQVLSYANVQVINTEACSWYYPPQWVLPSSICTAGGTGSLCRGDSGGPLTVYRNNRRILIGVVSIAGLICESKPAGYARVTAFLDFFYQHI